MPRLTEQGRARREFIREAVEHGATDQQILAFLADTSQSISIHHLRKVRRLYGVKRNGGRPPNWTNAEIDIVVNGVAQGKGDALISVDLKAAGFKRSPHGINSIRKKHHIHSSPKSVDLARKYKIISEAFAAGKTDDEIGVLIGKKHRTVKAMRSKLGLFRETFDLRQAKHPRRIYIEDDYGPRAGDSKFVAAMKKAIKDGHEHVRFGIFKDPRPLGPPTRFYPTTSRLSVCGSSAALCAEHGDRYERAPWGDF